MLDKKDLKLIKDLNRASIFEFWDEILSPYLDKRFEEIDKRFDDNSQEHEEIFKSQNESQKRIKKLERIASD